MSNDERGAENPLVQETGMPINMPTCLPARPVSLPLRRRPPSSPDDSIGERDICKKAFYFVVRRARNKVSAIIYHPNTFIKTDKSL